MSGALPLRQILLLALYTPTLCNDSESATTESVLCEDTLLPMSQKHYIHAAYQTLDWYSNCCSLRGLGCCSLRNPDNIEHDNVDEDGERPLIPH